MRQIWGGGAGEKNRLQYFEFGLQYLVQPLGVNPTYSTFKEKKRCCATLLLYFLKNCYSYEKSWLELHWEKRGVCVCVYTTVQKFAVSKFFFF